MGTNPTARVGLSCWGPELVDAYEGSFEQVVFDSLWRSQVLRFTDDIAAGELWSVPLNSPEFLDSLQHISEWENPSIWPYWVFAHIGSKEPN